MQAQGYLYAGNCRNHKDYKICKEFLNRYVSDEELSLGDSCYYLNNYNHIEVRGGHRYARASHSFKFILKKNMKYFHKFEHEYCYHGTKPQFLRSIISQGLKVPNGGAISARNGSVYGVGIYSTKIPEYAQLYADVQQWNGKYFQVILLLRQDLAQIKCEGTFDVYGTFTKRVIDQNADIKDIHLLHSKLIKSTDIQWMTTTEDSIIIEGILVKVHDEDPSKGQFRKIAEIIRSVKK